MLAAAMKAVANLASCLLMDEASTMGEFVRGARGDEFRRVAIPQRHPRSCCPQKSVGSHTTPLLRELLVGKL